MYSAEVKLNLDKFIINSKTTFVRLGCIFIFIFC